LRLFEESSGCIPSMEISAVVEDMLPFMLCAGVGSELPVFGDAVSFEGKSVDSYGEGLCGVCGWSEGISAIDRGESRFSSECERL